MNLSEGNAGLSPFSSLSRSRVLKGDEMDPLNTFNLTSLLPPSTQNGITSIPSVESILSLITQRSRHDSHSIWLGDDVLLSLNPQRVLGDVSEASKAEYEERTYNKRKGRGGESVQPHVYELATRVYYLMRRTGESQSIVFR